MSSKALFVILAAATLALSGALQEAAAQGMMGGGMMGPGMMGDYRQPPERYRGENGDGSLDTATGRAFASTCARCHVLPDPRQHTAQQWPGVVARMQAHMRDAQIPLPGKQKTREIESFLEHHAGS